MSIKNTCWDNVEHVKQLKNQLKCKPIQSINKKIKEDSWKTTNGNKSALYDACCWGNLNELKKLAEQIRQETIVHMIDYMDYKLMEISMWETEDYNVHNLDMFRSRYNNIKSCIAFLKQLKGLSTSRLKFDIC